MRWCLAAISVLGIASLASAVSVHVDVEPATGTTAAGYSRLLTSNRFDNGTYIILTDGIQVGWKDSVSAGTFARTTDPYNTDALLMDGAQFNPDIVETIQIKNLPVGRYDVTLYGYDPQYKDKITRYDLDGNNDGTADVNVLINNRTPYNEISKTVSLDVSAAGIIAITIQREISNNNAAINGFDIGPAGPDIIPPAAVANLAAMDVQSGSVWLRWTAPADDLGAGGAVAFYDLRYATSPIDAGNWGQGTPVLTDDPLLPGQTENLTVAGLSASTTYYFALTSSDAAGNVSALSNVLQVTTEAPDLIPPAAVADLATTAIDANALTLTWTAAGDDGNTGTATSYDIRYATTAITDDATFAAAMPLAGPPTPLPAGTAQSMQVTGLAAQTTYYFAMKVIDDAGNVSALSNVAQATTLPPDTTAPAPITDLEVSSCDSNALTLRWTAPGDDGNTGTARAYDIRYSTTPIASEGDFTAAAEVALPPAPQPAGTVQTCTVQGLASSTMYHFAIKTSDDGVPPNVSGMSNVAQATTLPPREAVYGISNEFSLEPTAGGPYAPAVPYTGDVSVTNIFVDAATIVRRLDRSGPVYTGAIHFDVTCAATDIFVWLELSTDGGQTWLERRIHAIGRVGPTTKGTNMVAQWLVDGDHGHHCMIRVRVNDRPATYSNLDADNNKYPRPAPWDRYANIERLASKLDDFNFTDVKAQLPKINFYKSIAGRGPVKAGFARVPYFDSATSGNPPYFMHCCYLESADGQQYLILEGDVKDVPATIVDSWRNQIVAAYGIPEEHIMLFWTHVHNNRPPADSIFPLAVIQQAIDSAVPVEIGFVNRDMGTSHNMNRVLMTSATHNTLSYSNYIYDPDPDIQPLYPQWEYDAFGNIIGGCLDGTPWSSVQSRFDCPQDSYLQMLVFRSADTHAMRGIMVKFTGHPVMRDYWGDVGRNVIDTFRARFGAGVEIMYGCGYGGDHRFLAAQHYPVSMGSGRSANAFADALEAALPTTEFAPVTKVGVVAGYDAFGRTDVSAIGTDPEHLGICIQAFGLNDNYLSVLPSEAPGLQGLYVRARTVDLKHFYNAYGNNQLIYYYWGRFHAGTPNLYESFRMAQELVRSVNILEQSLGGLRWTGDANGDEHVDVSDLLRLAGSWGKSLGQAGFDPACDFSGDNCVDAVDLLMLAENWGR